MFNTEKNMNDGYIEEKTWFKCTIDNTTYDCYLEYRASIYLSKPWVVVTVSKYTQKKWWLFRWQEEEFECTAAPDITVGQYNLINNNLYFCAEYVKDWVKDALNRREIKIREKQLEIEKEKNLNILKQI